MWPIERSVVPPSLRTRSAIGSVDGVELVGLLVEQQVVVAEMRPRDVPVEVLGLQVQREHVGEQQVQRRRRCPARRLARPGRSASGAAPCAVFLRPLRSLPGSPFEDEWGVGGRRPAAGTRRIGSARWTSWTQIEPSPTADATRLTLPERTSPTANTPGRLVSSRYGARAQRPARRRRDPRARRSAPGLHEALVVERARSRRSHVVFGSAPVIRNTCAMSRASACGLPALRQVDALELVARLRARRSRCACAA